MEQRKKQLLATLLSLESFTTTQQLAERLGVSEKTIRNDLKQLDNWLKQTTSAILLRQPGIGVKLEATERERDMLHFYIRQIESVSTSESILDPAKRKRWITQALLKQSRPITIQQLSEQLYVSKATIRHDLSEVEQELAAYGLQLDKQPHKGLTVRGSERNKRALLVKLIGQTTQLDSTHPYEYALVRHAVRTWERRLHVQFTDESFLRLCTHLVLALIRIQQGHEVHMPAAELQQLRQKTEYPLVEEVARKFGKKLALAIPETEIAYMTLHLLGAKVHYTPPQDAPLDATLSQLDPEAIRMAESLIERVAQMAQLPLSQDKELFLGLAIHLPSAIHRLRHQLRLTNPILDEIKQTYRYTFEMVCAATITLEPVVGGQVSEDEIGYLTLHIQAALERCQPVDRAQVRILIVCTTGVGTSQLLATKIRRAFPDLLLLGSVPMSQLQRALAQHQPDLLISTIPLNELAVPHITVSPFFPEADQRKVADRLRAIKEPPLAETAFPTLHSFIAPHLVLLDLAAEHPDELIQAMGQHLVEQGVVDKAYPASAIARERLSSTYIGGGIAIPHGTIDHIHHSAVCVARLNQPIVWGDETVRLVFMPAVKLSEKERAERLFAEIVALVESPATIERLMRAPDPQTWLSTLV
ncbi:BglG family transcription antiterminator [Laceyella putida]|uniref:BglG family transcription antiterminator n=1 Tax=Laceyella putida TaxID=110101 RepID=A0ABW2RNW5_9BACL